MSAREPAPCGTYRGYQRHRREHGEVCPRCREAKRMYGRILRRRHLRARIAQCAVEAAREEAVLAAHRAGELVLGNVA